ncbi:hypothetical protein PF008_g27782 [Phytophthora fragariae]|uniref:Uncharacterized protein n=1 Tax=Phytophthora fragariae TaxID=53985 RepID=A0A6G0QE17_9STRA|nr:hypothetical protein PF008_g27782 [Phytophthora fragariae]
MERHQDAPSPRTPKRRRLSADAESDKKRRVSSSPSSPRDATLRIVTQTLRDENRQLRQDCEALQQDKRALGERLTRCQRRQRDLEDDVARVYRQKQQQEQKLQVSESKDSNSTELHAQQTTQEMDRFIATCALWQRRLAGLNVKLSSKAHEMETQEVQQVVASLVGGVEVHAVMEELRTSQEQLQWARWMQTDAASCLQQLHSCARETEVFEAMEKQLMDDRVVELETQLAQKRAVEREKEMELSSLRADQEELLCSSHMVPNDEFEVLVEQKTAMDTELKQLKEKVVSLGEEMARAEDERASLKQYNQKLLEETRQLRQKQETSEFEGIQQSMTQEEEIKKLQAQLQAAEAREGKMAAVLTAAKTKIEKGKERKEDFNVLYSQFSSAMDTVSEKTTRLEELEQQLKDTKTKARDAESRNKELELELKVMKTKAHGVECQSKELEKQVAQVQREKDGITEELNKVHQQCADLRELESQQKQLTSKMQSEITDLKAHNAALKKHRVEKEHQSVGQPSNENGKPSRGSDSFLEAQVAEKLALEMFVQHYSSAAEAKCNKLLKKVSELESAKASIQEQTKKSCSILQMCTQIDSCDEAIRASLLDVMATLSVPMNGMK